MDAPRGGRKRSLPGEEDDGSKPREASMEKKVRFPKGKKGRRGEERVAVAGEHVDGSFGSWMNPTLAAKERSKRRNQNMEKEVCGDQIRGGFQEILARSEVRYEDNASFDDDGIQIEPFNLNQEREEGYFDEQGNFVEYVNKEIKDAWLDSIDVEPRFAEANNENSVNEEDEFQDLSSEDVGKLKRSIADMLNPGETVIQALKRLKGSSSDKKEKMPEDTKRLFDQLTEDAMKLMENGDYNVYHEKRETFEREAEGYERLSRARGGSSASQEPCIGEVLQQGTDNGEGHSSGLDVNSGLSGNATSVDETQFDMFGEEDEDNNPYPEALSSADIEKSDVGNGTDYVFDTASGYYYSTSLGYYYDPGSGLYCSATTGKWYYYDEQSGRYDEVEDTVALAPVAE